MSHKRRKKNVSYHQYRDNQSLVDKSLLLSEVELLFSKKATLKLGEQKWQLPSLQNDFLTDAPFTIDKLLALKDDLNSTKSLLNDMDIDNWHQHTRRMHKGGLVVKNLREHSNAEMCTQAWAKFKEILGTYSLIPTQALENKQFNSLHLCEAPGAFIACMNQHLKNNVPEVEWKWIGTTLNPYYEGNDLNAMLDDDSFIMETRQHWDFGSDATGNIMDLNNLNHLKLNCEKLGPVHLVTADGSINCADNPGEQEQVVSQLILCESLAAIRLLAIGGSYVFKMFTAFECHMICMLYMLACLFEQIHFIKPATSKPGNSEVYVVCLNYHGNLSNEFNTLLNSIYNAKTPDKALLPLKAIPGDFIDRLFDCQTFFVEQQKEEIVDNISMFQIMSKRDKQHLYHVRTQVVEQFFSKFSLKPLMKGDRLVQTRYLDGIQRVHNTDNNDFHLHSNRKKHGTYNERDHHTWLEIVQQDGHFQPSSSTNLKEFSKCDRETQLIPLSPAHIEWLETPSETTFTFALSKGKKIRKILNSRFCSPLVISTLNTALENATKSTQELSRELTMKLVRCNADHCRYYSIVILDRLVGFTQQPDMTSLLLGQPLLCQCVSNYLQSQNVQVSLDSPTFVGKVDLVLVPSLDNHDAPVDSWDSKAPPCEVQTKSILLRCSIAALKTLKPGGSFVCQIYSSLTRFTVGLLYILHQLFQRIAIVKTPAGSLCCSERSIVCRGYEGCEENTIATLLQAKQLLDSCNEHVDLLEVIDMKCLYQEKFCSFVTSMNEQLAHGQISSIINLELFGSDVVKRQYEVLTDEIKTHFQLE